MFGDARAKVTPEFTAGGKQTTRIPLMDPILLKRVSFFIGIVPVWIDFNGEMELSISADLQARMNASVMAMTGVKYGFEYKKGRGVSPVKSVDAPAVTLVGPGILLCIMLILKYYRSCCR